MTLLEFIILFLQALILLGQLFLSKKMFDDEKSRNLCYFSIVSNLQTHPDIKSKYKGYHDLNDNLLFSAKGDSLVRVCGSILEVNGIIRENDYIPRNVYFEAGGEFSILEVPLGLRERDLASDTVEIIYTLKLRNGKNYKYQQVISMAFEKDENSNSGWWFLSNYNFDIKPGHR